MKEVKMIKVFNISVYDTIPTYVPEEILKRYVNIEDMENDINDLLDNLKLNFKDRAFAEKVLKYGYALAHINRVRGE